MYTVITFDDMEQGNGQEMEWSGRDLLLRFYRETFTSRD